MNLTRRMLSTLTLSLLVAPSAFATTTPCDGSWDNVPIDSVFVATDGDDRASGSLSAPVASIARALTIATSTGGFSHVAFLPGSYPVEINLDSGENGVGIYGCIGTSILTDGGTATTIVDADGVSNLLVRDLRVTGGKKAIELRGGSSVTLNGVAVKDAELVGISIQGSTTTATLVDVDVKDTVQSGGIGGFGIVVEQATADITGGVLAKNAYVGLIGGDSADISVDSTSFRYTREVSGQAGRGIHCQSCDNLDVEGAEFVDNDGAAVFANRTDVVSIDTLMIPVPENGVTQTDGHGIVVTSDGGNPGSYSLTMNGSDADGMDDFAYVLDGVTAVINNNTGSSNGGTNLFADQNSANVSGNNSGDSDTLTGTSVLSFDQVTINLSGI
jgi:hypothetical protein